MTERITRQDVAHVADLARLSLTDDELDAIEERLRSWTGAEGLDFVIAREGMTIEVR